MNVREYMNQAYLLDLQIKTKADRIAKLNELATQCTANMTGMQKNPSSSTSRMEDAVCDIIDLQNEIAEDMRELLRYQHQVSKLIRSVEKPEYRVLLEKRHLCGETWVQIATDMHLDMRYVQRLYDKALVKAEELLLARGVKLDTKKAV